MKVKKRKSIWESNSSTSNTLVIKKESEYYTYEEIADDFYIHDGTIRLNDFEMHYGRSPFRCLSTFREKWMYCMAALCNKYGDETWEELERILKERLPVKVIKPYFTTGSFKCSEEEMEKKLEEIEETLRNHGVERELSYWDSKFDSEFCYDAPGTGYSEDYGCLLSSFLRDEGITMEEFICNKKYVFIVDGDEYDMWGGLKKSGLINANVIEREV